MNAVLVFALVVRLSGLPNKVVLRVERFLACGGTPRPRAPAPLLRRPRPVVVVALPVVFSQIAQALLLGERVDNQRRHAEAAAHLPIFLPGHLAHGRMIRGSFFLIYL